MIKRCLIRWPDNHFVAQFQIEFFRFCLLSKFINNAADFIAREETGIFHSIYNSCLFGIAYFLVGETNSSIAYLNLTYICNYCNLIFTLTLAPFDGTAGTSSSSKKCTSLRSFGDPREIRRFFTPLCGCAILSIVFSIFRLIKKIKYLTNLIFCQIREV